MGKINVGKLLVGGIAAGIVLNIGDFVINEYILKDSFTATFTARNVDPAAMNLGTMVALDFALALMLVFIYAAIRPRFGPGPKTAVVAGLTLAIVSNVTMAFVVAMGFFTWDVWVPAAALSTVNAVIASLVGGALYSE